MGTRRVFYVFDEAMQWFRAVTELHLVPEVSRLAPPPGADAGYDGADVAIDVEEKVDSTRRRILRLHRDRWSGLPGQLRVARLCRRLDSTPRRRDAVVRVPGRQPTARASAGAEHPGH